MNAATDTREPDARLDAALARLQASRAALRLELLPVDTDRAGHASGSSAGGDRGLIRWWRRLRRAARREPVLNLAAEAARRWWRHQPWHESAEQISRGVLAQGRPLVRRHPLAAVALAAAGGAALAASRPWRWQALGQPLRALPGRATHWVLVQLGSAPVQAALVGMLLNALRTEQPATDHAPAAGTTEPAEPAGPAGPADLQAADGANTRSR